MIHKVNIVRMATFLSEIGFLRLFVGMIYCIAAFALQQSIVQASDIAQASDGDVSSWQPQKPITFIVPSNPGGGWDQTARFLQRSIIVEELSPVSFEVVNRGGAGGTISLAELVDRYEGDSHKLMMSGFGMVGSILMHDSKHDLSSTTPIARLTSEFQAIGVPANSPFQTLDDLIAAFKADPSSFAWGGRISRRIRSHLCLCSRRSGRR